MLLKLFYGRHAPPTAARFRRYWRLNRVWGVFGVLATILPLAVVYFMVVKPV